MKKTTVYLVRADYERLQALARAEGRSAADLVREAVSQYAAARTRRARPRSIAIARSGAGDLSERAEELLDGLGEA